MANVATARKLKAMGYDFVPGMKVSWIVTDAEKTPQQVEPFIDGRPFELRPDWKYYARRLAVSLARATESFGLDERALLTGQKGLDSFGCGDGPEPVTRSRAPDAKAPKSRSLDEYM
jgi:DNA polymerase I